MTATDWAMVSISAVSAIAAATAAIASWRSARATTQAAEILREEREEAVRSRAAEPMIDMRTLITEYWIGVASGDEGGETAKALQQRVRLLLERSALAGTLPKVTEFANAARDELQRAEEALAELEGEIPKVVDEGSAFE